VQSWPEITRLARESVRTRPIKPEQPELGEEIEE